MAALEFWQQNVERGVAPDPIGTGADAGALARMWPDTIPEPAVTIEDELAEVILSRPPYPRLETATEGNN